MLKKWKKKSRQKKDYRQAKKRYSRICEKKETRWREEKIKKGRNARTENGV